VTVFDHLLYASVWIGFGASHSLLASESIKAGLAQLGNWYRLSYNIVALVSIMAVVGFGEHWLPRPDLAFIQPFWLQAMRWVFFGVGAVLLVVAFRGYDLPRFIGLRQIRETDAQEDEPLRLNGLHRYVRHPAYLASFMLLWGRVGTEAQLATAIWGSLYLIIGMQFEERRLVRLYGDAYRDYQARVPQVLPWKGRVA